MSYTRRDDALSWGRVIRRPQYVAAPRFEDELQPLLSEADGDAVLPVGLQRSYGDSVLNSDGRLVCMAGLDRLISLDRDNATLKAEAGVTLDQIMRVVVPRGFFLPVTPGTRLVTVGGAIANDVHGKNHHRAGAFGRHVLAMKLLRSDGEEIVRPSGNGNSIFEATIGGLGLTGLIEWAEIKLQRIASSTLDAELIPYDSLAEFWALADASVSTHEHTVAWIDCTAPGGRGIFSRGNWSGEGDVAPHNQQQTLGVPFAPPSGLLNSLTVKLFNEVYFATQSRKAGALRQHYSRFFHPLDGVADWNRLYGGKGFWQYQCVVPPPTMKGAIAALLDELAASGQGSFLAVLKTFGAVPSPGMLSFPMEGATLALDFPNRGASTLDLFSRLDAIVREAGGRLYAAKDGRIPKDMFAAGYPGLERFLPHADPRFSSDFWRRVKP